MLFCIFIISLHIGRLGLAWPSILHWCIHSALFNDDAEGLLWPIFPYARNNWLPSSGLSHVQKYSVVVQFLSLLVVSLCICLMDCRQSQPASKPTFINIQSPSLYSSAEHMWRPEVKTETPASKPAKESNGHAQFNSWPLNRSPKLNLPFLSQVLVTFDWPLIYATRTRLQSGKLTILLIYWRIEGRGKED